MLYRQNNPLYWLLIFSLMLTGCNNLHPIQTAVSSPDPVTTSNEGCKKIAFAMLDDDNYDIYTACPDGTLLNNLTTNPGKDFDPAWCPNGAQLAFSSDRTGVNQIYLMSADGSNPVPLTFDFENELPLWLPDGKHIAFRTFDQQEAVYWWRVLNLENSKIVQFTEPSSSLTLHTPAWSPDGQYLAYLTLQNLPNSDLGISQIHVKNSDGTSDTALTDGVWTSINPIWSPDSSKIAYLSEQDGVYDTYALFVMSKNGNDIQRLTEAVYNEYADFTWSPDGKQIAVSTLYETKGITIINIETGASRELLDGDGGEKAPSWQP